MKANNITLYEDIWTVNNVKQAKALKKVVRSVKDADVADIIKNGLWKYEGISVFNVLEVSGIIDEAYTIPADYHGEGCGLMDVTVCMTAKAYDVHEEKFEAYFITVFVSLYDLYEHGACADLQVTKYREADS